MMRAIVGLGVAATLLAATPCYASGLTQLKAFLAVTQSARGTFSQTAIARSGRRPQQSTGVFALQRPGKFRWSYETPYKHLLVSDGETLWSYDPDLNQVAIKALGKVLGATPAALLAGRDLEKSFDLVDAGNADGVDYVLATPKGDDTRFEKIKLGLVANQPVSMEIHDNFAQITRLTFTRFEANPPMPAGLFHFVAPKGADTLKD